MGLRYALRIALVGTFAFLLSGCGSVLTNDYKTNLPNGYSILRTEEGVVGVTHPKLTDIEANVDGYRVYDGFMVGHVSKCKREYIQSTPGYFILEFKNGKAYQGLSKKQWLGRLHSYGIHRPPALHVPSASDEANGFSKPANP